MKPATRFIPCIVAATPWRLGRVSMLAVHRSDSVAWGVEMHKTICVDDPEDVHQNGQTGRLGSPSRQGSPSAGR